MASPGRPPGHQGASGSDRKTSNPQQDSPSEPSSGRGAPLTQQQVSSEPPPPGSRGVSSSGRGAPLVQHKLSFGPPPAQDRGSPSGQLQSTQQHFPPRPSPPWGRGGPSSGRGVPVGPSSSTIAPPGRPRAQTSEEQPLPTSRSGSLAQRLPASRSGSLAEQANVPGRGSTSSRGVHKLASRGRGNPSSDPQQQSILSFFGNRTPSSGSLVANNPDSSGSLPMGRGSPSSSTGTPPTRPQGPTSHPQGPRTSSQGSPYLPPRALQHPSTPGPSGSRSSSQGSSFAPTQAPPNPTTSSSPNLLSGSPGPIENLPTRSRASTSTSQVSQGAPATKPRTVLFKAFRVIQAISPEDVKAVEQATGLRGFISVEVGAFGTLPDINANFDRNGSVVPYPLVRLLRQTKDGPEPILGAPMGDGKCRIPLSRIEIGAELTEDLKVVSDSTSAHPGLDLAALRRQTSVSSTVLGKYLQGFVASMLTVESRGLLKICGVPAVVVDTLDKPDKQRLLLNKFLEGMELCGSLDIFKDGMPLLKEIWDNCKALNPGSPAPQFTQKGTYFYLLMYYNEKTNDAAIYLGRTKDLTLRHDQHSKALQSDKLNLLHYRMAREFIAQGATQRLFPITFIPDDIPNAGIHCSWTETILISDFESFNPVMLGWRNYSPSKLVLENIPDWGRSAQQDGYLRTYTRPCALMILDTASQIKNSEPSLQKLKIREPFTGLNWCVPLAEGLMLEANMWIGTKIPSVDDKPAMWSFRTQPKRLTARRGVGILYGSRRNSQPVRFRRIMPVEERRLVPGSIINVVLEVTTDAETRHPYSYLQMPTTGPLDCWREAFRLAVRIEFEDEGKWYSKYLTQQNVTPFSSLYKKSKDPDDPTYEINNIDVDWIHAIKTVAALLNWRWQPENALSGRVWSPYVTRTRTMEFDFFNQQLLIGTLPVTDKQCPRVLTLDETSDMIEREFGPDVNIGHLPHPILIQDPEGNLRAAKRTKCDLCYLASHMKLSAKCLEREAVTTVDGIELLQCPLSVLLGRYCTFTDGIEHREDLHDLVFHRSNQYPAHGIDPPPNMFQYLEMRDSTAGQAFEDEEGE